MWPLSIRTGSLKAAGAIHGMYSIIPDCMTPQAIRIDVASVSDIKRIALL
jgi:hypothetical protein